MAAFYFCKQKRAVPTHKEKLKIFKQIAKGDDPTNCAKVLAITNRAPNEIFNNYVSYFVGFSRYFKITKRSSNCLVILII